MSVLQLAVTLEEMDSEADGLDKMNPQAICGPWAVVPDACYTFPFPLNDSAISEVIYIYNFL